MDKTPPTVDEVINDIVAQLLPDSQYQSEYGDRFQENLKRFANAIIVQTQKDLGVVSELPARNTD